jgi:hypothetical protein
VLAERKSKTVRQSCLQSGEKKTGLKGVLATRKITRRSATGEEKKKSKFFDSHPKWKMDESKGKKNESILCDRNSMSRPFTI